MPKVNLLPANSLGTTFDQRSLQSQWNDKHWRHLRSEEVEALVKNYNTSANWDDILVTDILMSGTFRTISLVIGVYCSISVR
jgi:hypothetical protein